MCVLDQGEVQKGRERKSISSSSVLSMKPHEGLDLMALR